MKPGISSEPLWWVPFSVGGMLAAMCVPIQLAAFWIAIPLGLISDPGREALLEVTANPLARIYLFVLVGGCLFHWAHRFRYILIDLGVHGFRTPIAVLCYGAAIAGTTWGGLVFLGG